jgi:predicted PurR-regulated permease PerM
MSSSRDNDGGWHQLTRGAPLAVLIAAALYILYKLLPVVKLVAVAMLIAVILRTLLQWLHRLIKARWLAVLLLFGLIVGFVVLFGLVVVPGMIDTAQTLLISLPNYFDSLITLSTKLHHRFHFIPNLAEGLTQFRDYTAQILNSFPSLLQQAFNITIEVGATLILALYIAYDPRSLITGFLRLFPRRQHQRIQRILRASEVRLQGWIFGTGIAMLFLGVSATLGLWVLGIPLAPSFGMIAGLFEVIPYFGSIFGTFLPALVALSISPLKLLFVLLLFLALNQIDAYVVQPLVMGQQVNLHPVVVIVTFLAMSKLLGFVGILLAVPAVAIMMTLFDEFTEQEHATAEPSLPEH